ncbi:energy coupling factor transporter S component ThiW [Azotosporobacter soli]|uniref:energy coupling factor transporter S component ThiW n=1 Tax=Azotosporobacter soli TaxID=3055040 RepID=UPI0031FE94F0
MPLRQLTFSALFVAIAVFSAHIVYIPVGIAKCFPIQHAINVLLAVLLGTRYAVSAAFTTSLLRNLLGTGSLLAFPGSMIGAACAGFLYQKTGRIWGAILGEIIGTGLIGGLLAFPIAKFLLGSQVGAFFFIIPFLISTTGGSLLAYLLCQTPLASFCRERLGQ